MRFILLYNCPLKTCDKLWLYNGLKKYGEVRLVSTLTNKSYFRISRLMPKLKIGQLLVYLLIIFQCVRALFISRKDDIVVTWSSKQGCIFNNMCHFFRIKRRVISFMWISLPSKNKKMIKRSFSDEDFMPIINNRRLEEDFVESFHLKQWNGMFLPDVFDDKQVFCPVVYRKNKYVFAGGVNNRDWKCVIECALRTPDIDYIVVSDRRKIVGKIPTNIVLRENLSLKAYHELMQKAFITLCPLKEDRVSGLINILKSAQFGIPCISTELDVTSMYYSDSDKRRLLFTRGDDDDLERKIRHIYGLHEEDYIKLANSFQKNIEKQFAPSKNVEKLMKELKRKQWI